jgi:hypothetical protein
MKIQDITLIGSVWQWSCWRHYFERANLCQDENSRCDLNLLCLQWPCWRHWFENSDSWCCLGSGLCCGYTFMIIVTRSFVFLLIISCSRVVSTLWNIPLL